MIHTIARYLAGAACACTFIVMAACGQAAMSPTGPSSTSPGRGAAVVFDYYDDYPAPSDPYPSYPDPVAPPQLVIAPDAGRMTGGTAVTISGSGFMQGATVTFGGAPAANVVVIDSASITAVTPAGLDGWVDVVVTNGDGRQITQAGGFTYAASAEGGAATMTITAAGVSPKALMVASGSRVTIVNNDARPHDVRSDPHPFHDGCIELNGVAFLSPGASRQTDPLVAARTCGFHDHNAPFDAALTGRIVVAAPLPAVP